MEANESDFKTEVIDYFLGLGFHKRGRCVFWGVVVWSTIGLLVSYLFFDSSVAAILPFSLFGLVWGLIFPDYLAEQVRQQHLSLVRGDDEK